MDHVAPLAAPHGAQLLLHGTPIGGSSTASYRGFHGSKALFEHLWSVEVSVLGVAARNASKNVLRRPTSRIDASAHGARLRAVGSRYLDELATAPSELVPQHYAELAPSSSEDAARQYPGGAHHVVDRQILDHDGAVALGVAVRENMQGMVALTPHLAVQTHDAELCLLSVFGSLLPPCDSALDTSESGEFCFQVLGVSYETSVGVSNDVDYPAVKGDDWLRASGWIRYFDLAYDRCKPLVAVPVDRARPRLPLKVAVKGASNASYLRKQKIRSVDAPRFGSWLAHAKTFVAFAFPGWALCQSFETTLPGIVQLNEKLGAHVVWYVSEPRQLGAKLGQIPHLVEVGDAPSFSPRTAQPNEPLLVRQVPQKSKSVLPPAHPRHLLGGWVDSVAKALVDDHGDKPESVCTLDRASPSAVLKRREGAPMIAYDRWTSMIVCQLTAGN